MTAAVDPARLAAALTAAGWVEEGRREGAHVRLRYPGRSVLLVPLDSTAGDHERLMGCVLAELEHARALGYAADRALTEATCSCGGRRWVDDEGWQPEEWAMAVQPHREPGRGLIPCGNCNEGNWDTPVGGQETTP